MPGSTKGRRRRPVRERRRHQRRDFRQLVQLLAHLRSDRGCPWDRAQTPRSLAGMLIEEAYEVVEAIQADAPQRLKDELGDLLLHVVFQAQIARETQTFTIDDVIATLHDKLLRRHPHVFGDQPVSDATEVRERWEEIKQGEGAHPEIREGLPALIVARKLQERAVGLGRPVSSESTDGLRKLLRSEDEAGVGELLWRLVALARELKVEPELALQRVARQHV